MNEMNEQVSEANTLSDKELDQLRKESEQSLKVNGSYVEYGRGDLTKLLMRSGLSEEEKDDIERKIIVEGDRSESLYFYLLMNQLDPVTQLGNYSQGDILKKLRTIDEQ
jgi:hypothetical protein